MLLSVASLLLVLSALATAPALLHLHRAFELGQEVHDRKCRIPLCSNRTRDDVCADHSHTTTRF